MEPNSAFAFNQPAQDVSTILIVEDSFLNRRLIKKTLEKNYSIAEADNADVAIEILLSGTVHLAVIDIDLGADKKDGIWLGRQLQEHYGLPFIYLTAFGYSEISQKAVATQPAAYLTKPFKEDDLILSIEIAIKKQVALKPQQKWVLVKDNDFTVKLLAEAIDYFESTGNYLNVVSNGRSYKCRSTIKEMIGRLPEDLFMQTHRAFIVNKKKISKFNTVSVCVGQAIIPVSEKFAARLEL